MAWIVRHNDESVREGYIRNGGKEVKLFTSALKAFQCNKRIVMAQRKHLDDFLRGRTIVLLECVDVSSWKYPRNLESPRVSSPGFGNDSKMMVMGVDVTSQVVPELQRRMRTGIWQLLPKETDGAQHQTCLVSSLQLPVSGQTMYRRLGHIGLNARRPVACVPLTATHCRLRLTWSREHTLWTPQQWSCVMFSLSLRRVQV
ncbi:transposable element Tcb1 transposase [Trichonephila clavipes]|nr:transposable element Tcb1 transposase [Trichonephila clavipes]